MARYDHYHLRKLLDLMEAQGLADGTFYEVSMSIVLSKLPQVDEPKAPSK